MTAADGTPIDEWIGVVGDRLIVRTGKVEIGTGLVTAMAQIAAEELDFPFDRVDVYAAHTGRSPDEGYTAGSRSIKEGGAALRHAAAEARQVLLEKAAVEFAVDPRDVRLADGSAHCRGMNRTYAELLGGNGFGSLITGTAPLKNPADYRLVGTAARRPDIARKAIGQGGFVSDVRLPGMWHGRMVRPRRFGARLLDVDATALPDGAEVIRKGDLLAVVAEREDVAYQGMRQLQATWGPGRDTPAMDDVFDDMPGRPIDKQVLAEGEGFVEDIAREYRWPFQAHASIGPSCAVADVRPDGVTVYAAAQGVYPLRRGLADLLGVPEETVEVVHREGSGCYGHNGADDVAADAAWLSQLTGRPIRVQWTREDEIVWARKGPATLIRMSGALGPGGDVCGWRADIWTPTHGGRARTPDRFIAGYQRDGVDEPEDTRYVGGDRNAVPGYVFDDCRVTMHWLRRPALPSSSLRALGSTANTFANESFVDELSAAAGADPLEFRRRHLTDPRALAVLEAVSDGWGAPLPPGSGRGVAYARYENTGAYLAAVAEVTVDVAAGSVRVDRFRIAHDCGLVINPDGLRNQIEGNVLQSLSRALKEEVRWDADGLTTYDWETYPILRFSEVPPVEVILIDRPDEPPVGAGEPATITTAPAIANAVFAATGIRLRQVPLRFT